MSDGYVSTYKELVETDRLVQVRSRLRPALQ